MDFAYLLMLLIKATLYFLNDFVMLSSSNLLQSFLLTLYRLLDLSAVINNRGSLLIILNIFIKLIWEYCISLFKLNITHQVVQDSSNALACSFFVGVKTDLNPKLLIVVASSISFGVSKKNTFHRIRLIALPSLNIRFFRFLLLINFQQWKESVLITR